MATADKLNKLLETKQAIKQAIIDKGVEVGEDIVFADYANKINGIQTGVDPIYYTIYLSTTNHETSYYGLFKNCKEETLDLSHFDTSNVTDMSSTFMSCENLTSLDLSHFNTSNVTTMTFMFYNCNKLTTLDLSSFDTSKVNYMKNVFQSCSNLTSLNVSSFNTSNVSTMYQMFAYCSNLTSLDVSNFNTDKVTDMYGMFQGCKNLTELDLSSFNTSNATSMQSIFSGCSKLTTIIGELDASNLTNGFYSSSYYASFKECTSLESVYLKNIYANCTMTNASKWSINLGDTKVKDECLIYIINELPDLINDKGLTATDQIVFTLPPTNTLTAEQVQIAIDKGWNVVNTNY